MWRDASLKPSDSRNASKSIDRKRDKSCVEKSRQGIPAGPPGLNISVFVRIKPAAASQPSVPLSFDSHTVRLEEDALAASKKS
jgi:hypothetical protein